MLRSMECESRVETSGYQECGSLLLTRPNHRGLVAPVQILPVGFLHPLLNSAAKSQVYIFMGTCIT